MTGTREHPTSDHGVNYAFILAITAHMANVELLFLSQPAEPNQTLEQTLWAQDMATNLRLVREFGLQKLADYYIKKDVDGNGPHGLFKLSFCFALESRLLGPRVEVFNPLSTQQILAKIDELAPFTGVLLYTSQLREKLYIILQNSAKVLGIQAEEPPAVAQILNSALADLFLSLRDQKNIWEELDLHALSLQLDASTDFLRKDSPVSIDSKTLFNIFKIMLESQLQVSDTTRAQGTNVRHSVLQLRELGNNLMENSSFPQAIKVYSQAIYTCDHTCSNNIPQLYTNRAIAFIGLNCFAEATSDLNLAVRYDRSFTPAWAQLGYCHLYQGSGFLALKCYFTALRTIAGEVYPENFPDNKDLRQEYTLNKMKSAMPQFVQRLVQSIILTEKRAEQQKESPQAIQEITTKVRAILARLRSVVETSDLSYLLYSYENEAENVRATAARANRSRPNILTPDVAQDLMASANMEASAITIPPAINVRTTTTRSPQNNTNSRGGDANRNGNQAETNAQTPATTRSSDNLLGFFNNLGEIFNDAVQSQEGPNNDTSSQNISPVVTRSESRPAGSEDGARAAETQQQAGPSTTPATNTAADGINNAQQSESDFRNTIRNFVPGIRGNLGGLINQALRHHQQSRDLHLGRTQRVTQPGGSTTTTTVRRAFSPRIVRVDRNGNSEVISNPVPLTPNPGGESTQPGILPETETETTIRSTGTTSQESNLSTPVGSVTGNTDDANSMSRQDLDMSDQD